MSNSTTSPLASRFSAWWKARSQRLPRRSTLQHAAFGQVAADLLRHAHADVLDDLLGAPHMRRDLGDRLEDQMQVADRDALGKQQLQHRLQAGIGDVRRADLVGQLLVFRVEPVDQRPHVLVGEKLRQVVADDLATDASAPPTCCRSDVKPSRFRSSARRSRGPTQALMPKAGSRTSSPGNVGHAAVAGHHQHFADAQLMFGDHACRGS